MDHLDNSLPSHSYFYRPAVADRPPTSASTSASAGVQESPPPPPPEDEALVYGWKGKREPGRGSTHHYADRHAPGATDRDATGATAASAMAAATAALRESFQDPTSYLGAKHTTAKHAGAVAPKPFLRKGR